MIRILSRLFRLRLALLNGNACLGGYLIFPAEPEITSMAAALSGVVLLAAGGSALNQVLERDLDRIMARTMLRPLPRGDLAPPAATVIGILCILAGFLMLGATGYLLPPLLGAAALVLYLGFYTPLKRRTPLALAIGCVCGALPPVIGWCCAGGSPADYRVMLLAGLLYLWQIPHFWLIQRRHADDFLRAGIPLFVTRTEGTCSTPLCRLWIIALVAAAMLLPAFGIIERHVAFWYAGFTLSLIVVSRLRTDSALYSYLNFFPVLMTLAICV
jgi:protoheme IX farnesyltransferase